MKHSPSDSSIVYSLLVNYNIDTVSLTPLPWGADLDASLYRAQAREGTSYFIKLKRGDHHDLSVEITELLSNADISQIILPIRARHGKRTGQVEDCTMVVYPFVEGENGFSKELTEGQWIMLGRTLRQIHDMNVPLALQHKIRRERYSSRWREGVRSLYPLMEAEPKLIFLKEHQREIYQLVDRAEQLAQQLQHESPPFVLCHSDIHGGNLLLQGDDNLYIVDWDDPIMAPKERDLMFIGGGVGNVWNKPEEEEFFYKGYGKSDIHRKILAYYRHERIVEDIALYSQELLEGRGEEVSHYLVAMFKPFGVVDIAFKSIDF